MQSNTLYSNIKLSIPSDLLVLTSSASGLNEQLLDSFYEEPYTQSLIAGRMYQYQSYSVDSQLATFSNLHSTTIMVSILAPSYIDLMYFEYWIERIIIRDQDLIVSSYSNQKLKTFLNSSKPYSTPASFPFADVRANPSPEVYLEKQYRLFYPALLPKSLSADLQEENVAKYVYYVTNHVEITQRMYPIHLRFP